MVSCGGVKTSRVQAPQQQALMTRGLPDSLLINKHLFESPAMIDGVLNEMLNC